MDSILTCNPMAQHNSKTPLFQLLNADGELSFGVWISVELFPMTRSLRNDANFPLPEEFF